MTRAPDPLVAVMIGDRQPMGQLAHYPLQPMPEMDGPDDARPAAMVAALHLVEACHHHAARALMATDRPAAFHRLAQAMAAAKLRTTIAEGLA